MPNYGEAVQDLARHATSTAEDILSCTVQLREESKAPKDVYSRADVNREYISAITNKGTAGKAMANKLRGDILSALEREENMRLRSDVRMLAHAAAKLITHGLEDGVINQSLINYVSRLEA